MGHQRQGFKLNATKCVAPNYLPIKFIGLDEFHVDDDYWLIHGGHFDKIYFIV